jgi:hypothetical protein
MPLPTPIPTEAPGEVAAAIVGPRGEYLRICVATVEGAIADMERDPRGWEGWQVVVIER